MTLDTSVTFDTNTAFVIPLVVLLTPPPVMWRNEHLRNFSVLQRVHLSSLVFFQAPIVISRDHHDVSGTDSPYRETSNISDGSAFTAGEGSEGLLITFLPL
jgi:urocanate hydratase